jgi:acyl carrier protein phosphodiesterase
MISDFVKGKKQFDYPALVQHGIQLHRQIDNFTDQHPVTREAKTFFKPAVGLYAGAFVDVVYDHFLALDTTELDAAGWQLFSATTYNQLDAHAALLPERFGRMLPYMRQQDWLYNYRFRQGISNSFNGLARGPAILPGQNRFLPHLRKITAHWRNCTAHFSLMLKKWPGPDWMTD